MNPMPQLEPLLKQLRLSFILDSLEARNRQAIEAKLAYTDFLALLVEDEVARRDQRQFAQRLSRAQVVGDKTLERFDCSHSPSVNHALIAELAPCRFVFEHAPVLIAGPTGTGKSHLVQSLCHCALRAGHEVLFISHAKLLAQLHAARATDSFERKLRQLARVDVLAIDDFGLRPMRSPQDEDFHDLIDARYERTTTLLTSNKLCGAPHNLFNAELKIMQSPVVRGSDLMLFLGLFAAHKGAGLEQGDQVIGRLEAPGA